MEQKNDVTLPVVLQSSANPKKISLTIKGIAGGLLTLLIMVGVIPADSANEVNPLIDSIVTAVEVTIGTISAWALAYGGARKVYNRYFKRSN